MLISESPLSVRSRGIASLARTLAAAAIQATQLLRSCTPLRPIVPSLAVRLPGSTLTAGEIFGDRRSIPRGPRASPRRRDEPSSPPAAAPDRASPPDRDLEPRPPDDSARGCRGISLAVSVLLGSLCSPLHADPAVIAALEAALSSSAVPRAWHAAIRREIAAALAAAPDLGDDKRSHAGPQFGEWLEAQQAFFSGRPASDDGTEHPSLRRVRVRLELLRERPPIDGATRRRAFAEEAILLEAMLSSIDAIAAGAEPAMRDRLERRLLSASQQRTRRRGHYFFEDPPPLAEGSLAELADLVRSSLAEDHLLRAMAAGAAAEQRRSEKQPATARLRRPLLETSIDLLGDRIAAISSATLRRLHGATAEAFVEESPALAAEQDGATPQATSLEEFLERIAAERPADSAWPPIQRSTQRRDRSNPAGPARGLRPIP